jgi:MFS family permease
LEIREGLRTATPWLIAAIFVFCDSAFGIPLAHVIPYLIGLGYRPENAAMVMSLTQGTAFFGSVLLGFVGDKVGGKIALACVTASFALGMLVLLAVQHVGWVVFFVLSVGICLASAGALAYLLLSEAVGLRHHSFFSGLVGFPGRIALGVSPFIGGRIIDITGGYSKAFELGSAFALAAAIVALFLPQARFNRGTTNREGAIRRSHEYFDSESKAAR